MSSEIVSEDAQEIVLDGSNKVSFPGFPYFFEALNEKVLVSLDQYKSGYECKTCKGKGTVVKKCECTKTDRPGFRYSKQQIDDIAASINTDVATTRMELLCDYCKGKPDEVEEVITCPTCEGKTGLLVIPDTAKVIASSGVVVSMGRVAREKADYKIGDRILFSVHAGSMIPTKSGLMFKQLDWYQAWIRVEGAEELGAFDFIVAPEEE